MKALLILGPLCVLGADAAVASAAPAWCKGGDERPTYDPKSLYTETDALFALLGLVAASCYPEADVARQGPQIAKTREAWSKRLGLTEADWADVSEWAHLPRHLRGDPKIDVTDRKAAWSAYSPLDQYGALVAGDLGQIDMAYLADAFGSRLTQLGRLGYVMQCLGTSADRPAATYAMCATDAAALDAAKLAAEIRGDTTHGAADRMAVRIAAYELLGKLSKFNADVKALRAKDPAYETMFALGTAAHAQWEKVDPRWIALVADLDDARATGSRKKSAGCSAKSWEAWKSVVGAVPARTLAKILPQPGNEFGPQLVAQLVSEPDGYLAALAVAQCAQLEEKEDALSRVIGHSIQRWPGFRGPRTATQTAILTADLKLDDRDASIDVPNVMREWIGGDGNVGINGVGAIAKIEVEGERATIRFKKEKVTQTRCTKGHSTSRIRQIMGDGTVIYWYQCDQEITETIEVEPSPPIRVGARYVAGLKPGMTVRVSDDVPFVAYPKGKGTPAVVTGVVVK
jgi:hypothetical protein